MRILNEEEKVGLSYCQHFEIAKTSKNFKYAYFFDRLDEKCIIKESLVPEKGQLWLGREYSSMYLDKDLAKKIITVLQHFVETGKIPEVI
jgi:hypothetical protein